MARGCKLAIIGAGQLGGTLALLAVRRRLGDVVLLDPDEGAARGRMLDIAHAQALAGGDARVSGTSCYDQLAGADVCIVCVGRSRRPGMTRDELLAVNLQMITDVAARVRQSAPDAFHILACNPLEAMLTAYHRHSGLPRSRVVGMAGVLDSARFRAFVALELGCSAADVQAMVIGSHGPEMVPLPRLATVAGMPLTQLLPAATIEGIVRRTQEAGTEILNLQRNASACCGPAGAALVMAEAYLGGGKRLLPCTAYLDGEYGLSGLFLGVPCWVDDSGISRIEEIELTTEERAMFERSAQVVRSTLAEARL